MEETSKPKKSNLCYYYCFEYESKKDGPWYKRNVASRILFYTGTTIGVGVIMFLTVIILFLLLGLIADLIMGKNNCGTSIRSCLGQGGIVLFFYLYNAFTNLIEVGPTIAVLYFGILKINKYPYAKYTLIAILTIIVILCPIFINVFLAWIGKSYDWNGNTTDDGCVIGDMRTSLNSWCFQDGIRWGLLLGGITTGVYAIIIGIYYLHRCIIYLRQQQDEQVSGKQNNDTNDGDDSELDIESETSDVLEPRSTSRPRLISCDVTSHEDVVV